MNVGGASAPRQFASYKEALAWLFRTQRFGIKLGLENIQRLLADLQVPSPEQRIVHVAGTNGKGSVCAMIDSVARAAGYRTGLFTSPHLVSFRERIQVDGELISEGEVVRGLTSIRELVSVWEPHPTFFEIVTALSLLHFRAHRCEIVVLETGMGGRFDATNAVTPAVSAITPIDYDHQKWLGESLTEIAAEKAGIIKPRAPVISAAQSEEVRCVIARKAIECEAPLTVVSEGYDDSPVALAGTHQKHNAAVAVSAWQALGLAFDHASIREGLGNVNWPARFQRWNERIVIDGAHNPSGARVAAATWRDAFGKKKAALVLGVLRDKETAALYRELAPIAEFVVLPRFRGERAMPPEELAKVVHATTPMTQHVVAGSCAEALSLAEKHSARVLVAGSLHLAGEILAHLRGTPSAFDECSQ
ncbi:MAG: bifunctional folylpolyglutamate synthase/dihydrofolate synthase [Chthoniobacterales bacterium]|nr:bifunctional folylpolyglutamate synthase/dihydrofolate synthase [Chthoniobacterales bacterium]MBA3761972.1 bifunctional folylpolyglutamate synthase/dihydrofolate synthase [Chthoniobacterales bacterium]